MTQLPSAAIYNDFQGLARLRAQSGRDAQGSLREVARQFEALFMNMMLKSMRDAGFGDALFDSQQGDFYRDMFDQQLAVTLSQGRGIGLADVLVQQLQGLVGTDRQSEASDDPASSTLRVPARNPALNAATGTGQREATVAPAEPLSGTASGDQAFSDPQAFVGAIWPHARRAAAALGLAPQALVAQAALESGWGQGLIRHPDGRSSHNLFGIKADGRWQGDAVTVPTTEFEDGVLVQRRAAFRAYDSLATAFDDYVEFLRGNPRYEQALQATADPHGFMRALQAAGYATDPTYAHKVVGVLNSATLNGALERLDVGFRESLI